MATNMTHLAPLTWRGFCLATPPLLCKGGAGLSANLLGVVAHNLSDGRCWPGRPTLPLRRMAALDQVRSANQAPSNQPAGGFPAHYGGFSNEWAN
jgi:hypothetical protein